MSNSLYFCLCWKHLLVFKAAGRWKLISAGFYVPTRAPTLVFLLQDDAVYRRTLLLIFSGTLEEHLKHHSGLLDLHAAQLSRNKQHLQELEAASYDGKLIWKIEDFRNRREAEAKGQPPCLSSVPFHTGRCGYKMAAKVYLNGDGEGRGTHLSLYVVLMPGDFDALLPWPFRQTVSLSVLDQSGTGNHRSLSFRPDPTSKSFQRPATESASNVAVGFSCFIPLNKLETPQNAVYVSDDTLFVKVKVDMAGLDQLWPFALSVTV